MKNIYCIGELIIDFVSTDNRTFKKHAGGAPANVAVAIQRLDGESYFLGQIGEDQFGHFLETTLEEDSVDTSMLVKGGKTTLAFVSVDHDGERTFEFNRGADVEYHYSNIDFNSIKDGSILHFGSATGFLGGNLEESYCKLLDYGLKHHCYISFDPNYRSDLVDDHDQFIKKSQLFMKHADVIKLSLEELYLLTGIEDLKKAMQTIRKISDAIIITTLGSEGCLVMYDHDFTKVASINVKQVDATGAGDAFIGALLYKISMNNNFSKTQFIDFVSFANRVGALTSTQYGAIPAIPFTKNVKTVI